jgi:hypothetical protein
MQSAVIKGDGVRWSRIARRLARSMRYGAVCSAALLLVACGGDNGSSPAGGSGSSGSAASSGGGGSSSSTTPLTAAQITQAAASAQNYYLTLPHTSLASDLTTLAAYMVSSGKFSAAAVSPGGISATLPDGSKYLLFADRVEDLGGLSPASVAAKIMQQRDTRAARPTLDSDLSPANSDEIAFLINESGDPAFTPTTQQAFAQAFTNRGFAAPNYGVDALDVSLENILALGAGHPLDFLDIATHGAVFEDPATGTHLYGMISTTPITDANNATYAADLRANRLMYGSTLATATISESVLLINTPTYVFTPEYLTTYLTFNSGAIVSNQSCFGQYNGTDTFAGIDVAVQATFKAAQVGLYLGWNFTVSNYGADQTDGWMMDRMLGEQTNPNATGLAQYAYQTSLPQRPFPLTAILDTMADEPRAPAVSAPYVNTTFAQDPYIAGNVGASLISSDFGGSSLANPPIEYALPSISQLQVVETSTGGTLTILGNFPSSKGTVQITDGTGTYPLTPTAWTTSSVTVTLPPGGNGSSGLVQVTSSTGIQSNQVPLTQWTGQLLYTESDTMTNMSGQTGSGSVNVAATFNINFRADVHMTATDLDKAASPQTLTFNGPMGNSSASVTAFNGSFTASNGTSIATFSLVPTAPAMVPAYTPPIAAGAFGVLPEPGQPTTCNSGLPGPHIGPTNVFCPAVLIHALDAGVCSDTDGTLCGTADYSPSSAFGYPITGDGLLVFTMDPATYAITVTSTPGLLQGSHLGGTGVALSFSMTGTIQSPTSAPTAATPASIRSPDAP